MKEEEGMSGCAVMSLRRLMLESGGQIAHRTLKQSLQIAHSILELLLGHFHHTSVTIISVQFVAVVLDLNCI